MQLLVKLQESGEASCSKGLDWEKLGIQKTIGQDNLKLPPKGEETRNVSLAVGNNEDRQMSPTGYKVTAVVYYDDVFKKEFGEKADTRINAVMALVDEQFDEMKVKLIWYSPHIIPYPRALLIRLFDFPG